MADRRQWRQLAASGASSLLSLLVGEMPGSAGLASVDVHAAIAVSGRDGAGGALGLGLVGEGGLAACGTPRGRCSSHGAVLDERDVEEESGDRCDDEDDDEDDGEGDGAGDREELAGDG
jgi:hypothetical protein